MIVDCRLTLSKVRRLEIANRKSAMGNCPATSHWRQVVQAVEVIHIDTGKELRGGQRQLLLLARGLEKRGHRQLVVCPEDSALQSRAHQQGLRVIRLALKEDVQADASVNLPKAVEETFRKGFESQRCLWVIRARSRFQRPFHALQIAPLRR